MAGNSGGGGSVQTVTQKSEPWSEQKPFLTAGFDAAKNWWQNSSAPQYYPESTVTALNDTQRSAMGDIVARANRGSPEVNAAQAAVERTANNGIDGLQSTINGAFLGQDPSQRNLGGYAGGDFTGTGQGRTLNSASSGQFSPLAGGSTLMSTANGGFLNANPYLDATYDKAARAMSRNFAQGVMPSIDSAFARSGRFGSGLHSNAADQAIQNYTQGLGDLATGLYGNAYGQERGLQQQAAQGLLGTQLGSAQNLMQNQMASNAQVQGAYDTERNRMMQASIADNAAQMQAAGMAPQLAAADYADMNAKMGVGNMQYGQDQANMQDDVNRWNFYQNRDMNKLAQYMGMVNGGYGATNTTSQPVYNNRLASGVGGALGGAQLGGMFGGPWGAAAGALGGGLLGMF
jgi:hypothetical protein